MTRETLQTTLAAIEQELELHKSNMHRCDGARILLVKLISAEPGDIPIPDQPTNAEKA